MSCLLSTTPLYNFPSLWFFPIYYPPSLPFPTSDENGVRCIGNQKRPSRSQTPQHVLSCSFVFEIQIRCLCWMTLQVRRGYLSRIRCLVFRGFSLSLVLKLPFCSICFPGEIGGGRLSISGDELLVCWKTGGCYSLLGLVVGFGHWTFWFWFFFNLACWFGGWGVFLVKWRYILVLG